MKRLIFTILAAILASGMSLVATNLADEDLHYKVMFKWGLINTQAGRATLSLRNDGTNYNATLIARSESWADNIYSVRDTLYSIMSIDNFRPLRYEKIANEKGKFSRDVINYTYNNDIVTGHCSRYRVKKGEKKITETKIELNATGTTVDMMSVFYYLRTLDFQSMKDGEALTINIFSGKRKELLLIKYDGIKSVKYDGKRYDTYRVSFRFTSEDGEKTSDDIVTWISTDQRRIPIKLEGSLPVGKIRCLYIGK